MAIRYYTRKRDVRKLRKGEWIDFKRGKGYYIRRKPPKPKPPVPPVIHPPSPAPQSLFKGRGMFTVEDVYAAAGLKLDYVLALQETYRWETLDGRGGVFQDESKAQYDQALASQHTGYEERALVTTLDGSYHTPSSWPSGWTCMPECYPNADPPGTPPERRRTIENMVFRTRQVLGDKFERTPVVLVLGCYDASGETPGGTRWTVPDYLPGVAWAMHAYPNVVGFCVWRVETLDPPDRDALK